MHNAAGNPPYAIDPRVAINLVGDAIAGWLLQWPDGTPEGVFVNRYASERWGTAQRIETLATFTPQVGAQVSIDSMGNAMAVWQQSQSGNPYNIWAKRYAVGVGWGTAQLIETENGDAEFGPQVAMDPAGNAIVVWYQCDSPKDTGAPCDIWANRYE